jgi:hypothetical protein
MVNTGFTSPNIGIDSDAAHNKPGLFSNADLNTTSLSNILQESKIKPNNVTIFGERIMSEDRKKRTKEEKL